MKQLLTRLKKLEGRVLVRNQDPLSDVFALSLSRLSDDQLQRTEEVLALCEGGGPVELSDAHQVAWNGWEVELAKAAEELQCTALLKADDVRFVA